MFINPFQEFVLITIKLLLMENRYLYCKKKCLTELVLKRQNFFGFGENLQILHKFMKVTISSDFI